METLGMTYSACGSCNALVPAKVVTDGRSVYFRKFCPQHGEALHLVHSEVADYLQSLRYVKPAWTPLGFAGDSSSDCPDGCGYCGRHEQHVCLPIVEITSRCDLACPICLVDAGRPWDMTFAEFRALLNTLIRTERQVDVLNVSGGEPLMHPGLLAFVDEALSRPEVVRVSISTNGLKLLSAPELATALRDRDVVVSLQFDGFDDKAYVMLRGRPLLAQKLKILDLLKDEGIATSLTMTAAGGVNDDQFRSMLDYVFSHEHVISMMIQPLAFAGRAARLAGRMERLTIPDIVHALGRAGHPTVSADDFVPLPCSHPLCMSLAFYLVPRNGRAVSVNRLVEVGAMLDAMCNRVFFGLDASDQESLQQMVYELWSGPAASAPDSAAVLQTIRAMLRRVSCAGFGPRMAFKEAERHVKSIFVHAFQDADTFDLARVRRCCNAYPQPDGRFVPPCARNVLGRRASAATHSNKTPAEVRVEPPPS